MNPLANFIQEHRAQQSILLMTHVIYGYPSVAESLQMMRTILEKKVAILEVQFPFTDPVADGPVITNACHQALQNEPELGSCIKDISALAKEFPESKVLLMSYLNPLIQYGLQALADDLAAHVSGVIIPDLPVDQYAMLEPLKQAGVNPIWLMIPEMSEQRLSLIAEQAQGLIYCVSRKGVTGQAKTNSEHNGSADSLSQTLCAVRKITQVPLALGFGISSASQVNEIKGKVDVAVVGSALLSAYQEGGIARFGEKIDELLSA